MKVPEPRHLPSGSWFIQMRLNGVSVPVTAPTKKQCIHEAEVIKAEVLITGIGGVSICGQKPRSTVLFDLKYTSNLQNIHKKCKKLPTFLCTFRKKR